MPMVFLGLGSNLGERRENVLAAIRRLAACPGIRVEKVSSLYETEPFGYKEQADFINAVVQIATDLSPLELLRSCQRIEAGLGRKREIHWGPRSIDIDILLFDDVEVQTAELTLPHPYLAQRRFVLLPLAELTEAPLLNGLSAAQLLQQCQDPGAVAMYESKE